MSRKSGQRGKAGQRDRQRRGRSSRSSRAARVARVARWLWGNAAYALLGLSVVFLLGALGLAARNDPARAAGSPTDATQPQWITLKSAKDGDILAAVRQSRLFTMSRSDHGDHLTDLSHVGTPQLVTELRLTPTSPGMDCYDVPILDRAGNTVGVAVAWLNPGHTAIEVGYIRAYDTPLAQWTGSLASVNQAVAIVQAQHHTGLRAHTQPHLVYFPFDFQGQQTGRVHWTAGGEGPDTPIWLVPGADGQDHLVGRDGHAYAVHDLPLNPLAH